jgi:hypothetical protein
MKDEIKGHFISSPERLFRRDHEFETLDFSVSVSRLMPNALKVLQKRRVTFLTLKEHMIIMFGALILTAIILWTLDSADNE